MPQFPPGSRVEGQYRGGDRWYPARVKAVNANPGAGAGAGAGADSGSAAALTYHLVYDDGDEEKQTPPARVRAVGGDSAAPALAAAAAVTAATTAAAPAAAVSAAGAAPKAKQSPAPAQLGPPAAFKVGDKVEALYYSGQTWYPACVSACRLTADGLSWCYDLAYDDGDREKKVGEAKVRLPGGVAEPATAAAAAAAPATPVPAVTANGKAQTKSKTGSNSNNNNNNSSSNQQQQQQQQQQQPAASLPPAELAALLRAMTREVLRGQAEYKAAFTAIEASSASDADAGSDAGSGSGAGLGGPGAHVSGSASLLALTRFAEDMLTEPLAGEAQAAALYALMDVDGSGLVTLDDFMRFLAGEVRTAAAAAAPVAAKPPLQQQQQQQQQQQKQQQQQQPVAEVASEQASVVSAVDSDLAPFGLGLGSDGLGLGLGLGQGLGGDGDAAGEVDSEGSMGLGLDGGGHVDIGDAEAEYGDEFDD